MAESFGARLLAARLASARKPPTARRAQTVASRSLEASWAPALPDYVLYALARMRLLHGVPFQYLVPDIRLLPLESIRFFHVDPEWLDELNRGALTVGGAGTREEAQIRSVQAGLAEALRPWLARVRDIERGRSSVDQVQDVRPPTGLTGLLLHSALVSGWPGLQVRAYSSADPSLIPPNVDPQRLDQEHPELAVPVLRLERLAPSVLMVLFGGTPRLVWLAEPHHGVQFGVEAAGAGYHVSLRDVNGQQLSGTVQVPLRAGAEGLGVVDVERLAQTLDATQPLGPPRGSAGLALALLRPPVRQRFATEGGPPPAPTNTWTASASMATPRYSPVATPVGPGNVLVVSNGTAELYDPAADRWAPTGSPLLADRSGYSMTRLASGQVFVAGGTASGTGFPWQTSAELYDHATGTWRFTGPMSQYRTGHTATLLPSGKVLVVSGYTSPRSATGSAELYDPATGIWSPAAGYYPVGAHRATLLSSGKVLVTGGYAPGHAALRDAHLYDPATDTWTSAGTMSAAHSGHLAVPFGSGKVLVIGGPSPVEVYNSNTNQWSVGPEVPLSGPYVSASLLSTGEVLVLNNSGQGSLFDPVKHMWRPAASLQPERSYFATVQLPSGQVMVMGGSDGTSTLASTARYTR